jgi:hypothetical protein
VERLLISVRAAGEQEIKRSGGSARLATALRAPEPAKPAASPMLLHGPGSVEVERLLTSMRVGGRAGDQKLRGDARAGQQEIRSSGGDERAGNRAARG